MGLKLRLTWFDHNSDEFISEEYSKDFGEDGSVIEALGIPLENNINNGEFEVFSSFLNVLQPHFQHKIDFEKYCYYVGFDYKEGDW